jgi:hypothetical protein
MMTIEDENIQVLIGVAQLPTGQSPVSGLIGERSIFAIAGQGGGGPCLGQLGAVAKT